MDGCGERASRAVVERCPQDSGSGTDSQMLPSVSMTVGELKNVAACFPKDG